jgi:hypothetical protein
LRDQDFALLRWMKPAGPSLLLDAKFVFLRGESIGARNARPAGVTGGSGRACLVVEQAYGPDFALYRAADVDEVVGDHTQPDPAVHSDEALEAAAVEAVSAFDHADAALASGAPFLTGTNASFVRVCARGSW